MNFLLKRILIRQILVRGLFVLALLAVGGLPSVSAQTTLPPCTMDIPDTDGDGETAMDIDKDGDGLIEICDLEGLNEMRFVLNGSGYKTTDSDMVTAITTGCPSVGGCTGYELTRHLNFMFTGSYREGSINTAWTDTSGAGWQPIGDASNRFSGTFNGDGYTLSNLRINRSSSDGIGLFGDTRGRIVNVGLLDVNITGQANVGGLVGINTAGEITNSYVTGTVSGSGNNVGGLVGFNTVLSVDAGEITNSCASVSVSGEGNSVGGLVGFSFVSAIENSCATGSVSGDGSSSNVGGLVGSKQSGSIENSYATGSVSGDGSSSNIGGLVGSKQSNNIRNSYATGSVSSSDSSSNVGGLVGFNFDGDNIENSYAIGTVTGSGSNVGGLVGLFETGSFTTIKDSYWLRSSASSGGTGVPAATSRTMMELRSPTTTSTEIYTSWSTEVWDFGTSEQYPILKNVGVQNMGTNISRLVPLCTADLDIPDDRDDIPAAIDVDKDGDGLIEICDLEGLDEMRHQLDGSGYTATDGGTPITMGCPTSGCTGYELTKDLDFTEASSYREGGINTAWTDTSGAGWEPIGDFDDSFAATFNGNGYTISNLMINRNSARIGLFGATEGNSRIANLGLLEVNVSGQSRVGGLVGDHFTGRIANSYVTGSVIGLSLVGGLAGDNSGTITNSYATASVSATGTTLSTGGLVGLNDGTIADSYATGEVRGGSNIGGLAGRNGRDATIRNSYARGMVMGTGATVGGLVGSNITNNNTGTITNSYWLDRPGLSRGNGDTTSTSRTAMQLTSPTAPGATSTDTYHNWRTMIWDFGTSTRYPALRYGGDCVNRDENTEKPAAGQPTCGDGVAKPASGLDSAARHAPLISLILITMI